MTRITKKQITQSYTHSHFKINAFSNCSQKQSSCHMHTQMLTYDPKTQAHEQSFKKESFFFCTTTESIHAVTITSFSLISAGWRKWGASWWGCLLCRPLYVPFATEVGSFGTWPMGEGSAIGRKQSKLNEELSVLFFVLFLFSIAIQDSRLLSHQRN